MLLTEYNEKKVMAWLKREAREEGRQEGKKEGRQEGRVEGKKEGENQKVISQVRKKAAKGRSPEEIAEMLEEDISQIKEICEVLRLHPSGAMKESMKKSFYIYGGQGRKDFSICFMEIIKESKGMDIKKYLAKNELK